MSEQDRVANVAGVGPSASTEAFEHDTVATRKRELKVALRNALRLGGSLLLTWAVALVVKLQLPAHFGPVRQGHYAFAESCAAITFSVVSLGIDTHIIKEVAVRPATASEFMGGVFALRTVLSALLFAGMFGFLVVTGRPQEVLSTALLFGVTQYFASVNGSLSAVLQAVSNVGRLAIANVGSKLIWGVGLTLGVMYDLPMWMLALPPVMAELLKLAMIGGVATAAASIEWRIHVPATRAAVAASVPFFVNTVANVFGSSLALSALEFIRHDQREVGWFSAASNLASLATLLQPLVSWVVLPMMARAKSRSDDELALMLRRAIEGILIVVTPGTLFMSMGAHELIGLAFGPDFAPAALGFSVLSLVFLMMYTNVMLANSLILDGRGWTVTLISIGCVLSIAGLMLVTVPLGRIYFGTGGECAGGALAVVLSEIGVVIAMLLRGAQSPFDARNRHVVASTVIMVATTLILNRMLMHLGPIRLAIDMAAYVLMAFALRVVRPADVGAFVRLVRQRGA